MGCTPYLKTNKGLSQNKKLVILPGTFVKINQNEFRQVYKLGKTLGTGSYAEVRLCMNKQTRSNRAVKIITKESLSEIGKIQFIKEVEILKKLDHPNIIRILEFFEDEYCYYIVMEHCEGGELFDEIFKHKKFSEYEAAHMIKQVLSCVAYLHSINVIHRDIKAENLLLEEKDDLFNIKLIDFGIATTSKPKGITGLIGTPSYLAPEVITGKYTEKCDLWSVGVLMYILLSGCPPFQASDTTELYELIKKNSYNLDNYGWENVSADAKDLITKLLVPEKTRISAEQALKHPWLQNCLKTEKNNEIQIKSALNNLTQFHSENKLRDASILFIITQLLSATDLKFAKNIFLELDENGDGKLSKQELINGYKKYFSEENTEALVNSIMKEVDTDDNGFIDYNEFLKATVDINKILSNENL